MKLVTTLLATATLTALTFAADAPLSVGTAAPAPVAKNQDGKSVNFKDAYAKGTTLVGTSFNHAFQVLS